ITPNNVRSRPAHTLLSGHLMKTLTGTILSLATVGLIAGCASKNDDPTPAAGANEMRVENSKMVSRVSAAEATPKIAAAECERAIRVPAGVFLAAHGLAKVKGGVDGFAGGLAEKGFPLPSMFAWAATLSELVGGALVALGLLCRPAAAFAGITMVVAVLSTHAH